MFSSEKLDLKITQEGTASLAGVGHCCAFAQMLIGVQLVAE